MDGKPAPPQAITAGAIRGKLEVLKLHDMVREAEQQAQQAQHEAVTATLAQSLLACSPKETSMAAMDALQWQRALLLLRDSGLAAGGSWLAAACQLRLMWHVLARLPDCLDVVDVQGGCTA